MRRGIAAALYAFAVFFLVAGVTLTPASPLITFTLATIGAVVAHNAALALMRPSGFPN